MKASVFYFDTCTIDTESGQVRYVYSTDAGHTFVHELRFDFRPHAATHELMPAAFSLGMAELVHFWKAFLTPRVVVRAGALSAGQIVFWETLYTKGLGEFFFKNNVDFRGLVSIESDPHAPVYSPTASITSPVALVPFGGGKDSLVTGELLQKNQRSFVWFELEPLPFGKELQSISGVSNSLQMGRDVSKNFAPVMELVRLGAPNGHVPITATYAFAAVLAAKASGLTDVVLSVERSANEGNTEYLGMEINHQYAKSFEFERALQQYVRTHIDPSIRIFSLLRPLYEIQIIRIFTAYPKYFSHFVSCNRGLKSGMWCGTCAKCAFMFAGLSAFLAPDVVVTIFKKNLFEQAELVSLYRDLVGLGDTKPFDCVGTFDENMLALYLASKEYKKVREPLPLVLRKLPIETGNVHLPLLTATTDEHLIPEEYQRYI